MVGLMVAISAHGERRRREKLGETRRSVDDDKRQDESSGGMLERGHLKAGVNSEGTKEGRMRKKRDRR
jgi:hypothetical protein